MNTFVRAVNIRNLVTYCCLRSTNQQGHMSSHIAGVFETEKEKRHFQDVLPPVINTLATKSKFSEDPVMSDWLVKVLEYNLTGGKLARGLTTVLAYKMSAKDTVSEESLKMARIMGWCVEMFQTFQLVLDDFIDGATMRRGRGCWHLQPGVGSRVLNDAVIIYSALLQTLKIYFSNNTHYDRISKLFNESLIHTSMGQHLESHYTQLAKNKDYHSFTIENYEALTKYKTSFYTFKLPVCLGLLLAHNEDETVHQVAEVISLNLGHLYQMQDDYIDCYSDQTITGKGGTDIQEGKCSWLAVAALERCSPAQRALFVTCYGSEDVKNINQIKQLYQELNLSEIYYQQEKALYNSVIEQVNALPASLSPDLYIHLANTIYKRIM